jgi:hypothetical protein
MTDPLQIGIVPEIQKGDFAHCPCNLVKACRKRIDLKINVKCEIPNFCDVLAAASVVKMDVRPYLDSAHRIEEAMIEGYQDGVLKKEPRKDIQELEAYIQAHQIGAKIAEKFG